MFAGLSMGVARKLKTLLYIVAQSVPFKPNMSAIAADLGVSRNDVGDLLFYLEKAGLINQLRSDITGIRLLGKVDKVYLNNTNLMYAIAGSNTDIGNERETAFYTINNKVAWFLMEFPIFLAMIVIWLLSPHRFEIVPMVFLLIFEIHYFQRSIIFPWLMKGNKSQMPIATMFMGIAFNIMNAMMQGYWIFFESFKQDYHVLGLSYTDIEWLWSPQFIIGLVIFLLGFYVNLRSDYIIRHLRKSDEDTKHYLPEGFMFEYVTSANYLGELMEWLGFAILTWSISGLVFFSVSVFFVFNSCSKVS